jgi:hypothetical protein
VWYQLRRPLQWPKEIDMTENAQKLKAALDTIKTLPADQRSTILAGVKSLHSMSMKDLTELANEKAFAGCGPCGPCGPTGEIGIESGY